MPSNMPAFSGRGRRVRRGTAALLAAGLAATPLAVAATASPAAAWGGDTYGVTLKLTSATTKELTDGRNHVVATGAADEKDWGDEIALSFPIRRSTREAHQGVVRLAGGIDYTGAGPNVTWTRLRVDLERGVVTARVDGGDRAAILRIQDRTMQRGGWGAGDRALVLTRAGARSLNRAAAGTPFSVGEVFAGDSTGCGG